MGYVWGLQDAWVVLGVQPKSQQQMVFKTVVTGRSSAELSLQRQTDENLTRDGPELSVA